YITVNGFIDLVFSSDKNVYTILDFKTGSRKDWNTRKIKELKDFQNDIQLLIYFMAARRLYPQISNFEVTIFFINDGGPYTVFFSDEDEDKVINLLKKKILAIKSTIIPSRNINFKCTRFCDFGKTTFEDT